MDPLTIMMLGSTALSAFGQIQAGRASAGQSLQNAELELLNTEMMAIEAKQSAAIRMSEYKREEATNLNTFANMNRDFSDPSVKAFLRRQKEIIGEDLQAASMKSSMEVTQGKMTAASLRSQGRNQMRSATVGALTTIASGGYSYYKNRRPSLIGQD